jgi:hypothetical protein
MKHNCPKCGSKLVNNGATPAGKTRWACFGPPGGHVYCYSTVNPGGKVTTAAGKEADVVVPSNFKRALGGVKKLVITSAQNATPINKEFFASLLTYCEMNDAELIVIPYRYKNATSTFSESQKNEEWWAPELTPYLYNQRKKLCANLILLADIKTQPTATSPLTGFEGITHGESGIVGHPKMQMKVVPTPSHALPKIMHTTGSVSVKNYSDTKAGKKGEFHHVFGAVVVEVVGKKFHLRQINAASDGSFIDWDTEYTGRGYTIAPPALALVMGDTHYRFLNEQVKTATFAPGGIISQLQPKHLIWHDLLDGYSRNHHHTGNVFTEMSKRFVGREMHLVGKEVRETIEFLQAMTVQHKCKSIVVQSNHDDFLRQWIVNDDWKYDPDNAEFYLETALAMTRSVSMGESGAECVSPFAYWVEQLADGYFDGSIKCLAADESFELKGVELGMHGHRGPNGARGSIKSFSTIGVKSVTGHSHTPGIEGGAYKTGTSTNLRLEYTEGPSSWMNTHCVVYANGKRALINIIDGEFKRD